MYIAIEGIKGSGKSTIINEILAENQVLDMTLYPITASMKNSHPLERAHHIYPSLKNDDDFIENLFIHRAYWHQPSKNQRLIIGDRSILTSYVSRWTKWSDPYYTIKKVEYQYRGIQKPDVLIWLETDTRFASMNIKKRQQKQIRVIDETSERLVIDKSVYEELIYDGLYEKKVNKSQKIILTNSGNKEEIKKEIYHIFKYYQK